VGWKLHLLHVLKRFVDSLLSNATRFQWCRIDANTEYRNKNAGSNTSVLESGIGNLV